jgi:cholesterol oxidase
VSGSYDVVIIGSGFGGSINALRLSEAGRSVLVLERGRRWQPKDFPRDVEDTNNLLWGYPERERNRGLYELRFFSGAASVTASGVGGGSLIYASIHYRPKAHIFTDPRWPSEFNLDSLDGYYAKVATELGVEPVPASMRMPKRDVFHAAGAAMGREVFDTPQAVSWDSVFGATGGVRTLVGGRTTCQACAECEFGCRYGAKNTLDFTYLAKAEAQGARVQSGRQVTHVAPSPGGGWAVHYRDIESDQPGVVVGRKVVVAAGTIGSNELLLRSRDQYKTLPRLSARLGHGYSANGDFLGNIQNADQDLEPWVGPDVTSVMWHHDTRPGAGPGFVLATPTFNRPVMDVLASLGQPPPQTLAELLAPRLYKALPRLLPFALRRGVLSQPLKLALPGAGPAGRMVTVFGIGQDNANGRFVLERGKLDMVWAYERENRGLVAAQRAAMQELAEQYGGTYANLATWDLFQRPLTVHNLGGCALSRSADLGVVGIDGQVHGHAGLYVSDGSVIPTAIGSHPVMTISAVSEWIAERVNAGFA